MKKKLFYGIAVIAIAVVAAWNVNVTSKGSGLSDISLANVEALAQEGGNNCFNNNDWSCCCNKDATNLGCYCGM